MTTKNISTNKYRISADQIQNLEIDCNGRIAPRLHDLEPLENTLLSVLYPGIKVASVNVPTEPLDDYEESQVENALAKLIWNGIHYKLVGASGSAKKGKFYFVDQQHSRAIAERFQHWPQAAIVYFGILVSSCKVMMEEPDARVLIVPDHQFGTNDCRGWIRQSLFQRLKEKHDDELLSAQASRLRRERYENARDEDLTDREKLTLVDDAKQEIARKTLPSGRFYQFRMAFSNTQAKGSFKVMEDDVADALEADFVLPESAVKPGLKIPVMSSIFGPGRRFAGNVAVGIREVSRQLEFESSYTLVEHAPADSIQLEILPQAMKQVAKLSESVGEGRYEDLLEILGRHPDKCSDALELDPNEEFRVVEGLLLADASGEIVRHPYVNNQLNRLLARWAFKTATSGGFRLPAFALADDGYLIADEGHVYAGSDWIPQHQAIARTLSSSRGLCVRYPIRMFEDLLPIEHVSPAALNVRLAEHLEKQGCANAARVSVRITKNQLCLDGTYVLHSETAKKNGGDFDFDWICVVEEDRFPRFVRDRFLRGVGQQQGKNKANKARDPWFNLEHVAMKARGNHIGSITDLITSCRAAGQGELAAQLAHELQNALDSLKWQVQPDLKLVGEIRQQVGQAAWLRHKNERRISDLPLHLETEKTDRIGHLYNHVRKQIEDLLVNKSPIEAFKSLVVGEKVTREMMEDCRFVNRVYAAKVGEIAERSEQLKKRLGKAKADWDAVRQSPDKELRRQKLLLKSQTYAACHYDEEQSKYEMKAVLAFIRIWAQNKVENRMGWLQSLNRIVCNGQRSSGSILFLAFPQEMIVKLAERTGGKPVRVQTPKLYEGFIRIDSFGRTFLVDPIKGGQKHTFLFKLKDGKILLDDDMPEPTQAPTPECHDQSDTAAQAAVADDAVEFPPILPDGDVDDVSWVM